jgi:hypothetical protein
MRSDVVRLIIGPTYIFKEVEPEADALIDKDILSYTGSSPRLLPIIESKGKN